MNFLDSIKNTFLYSNKYKTHNEAIIISCYFNPQNNPYRLKAFNHFYDTIKHLNHMVIEAVIGDTEPQLPENDNIVRVYTQSLLWHKEGLLNNLISKLDKKYRYVFWVDADVIFTNKNWVVDAVEQLKYNNLVQLFEYCVHLDRDELEPNFAVAYYRNFCNEPKYKHPKMWRSFSANYVTDKFSAESEVYDTHGHVGFAWGAKREVLDKAPLYDRAFVGGADHIIAHAAAGQIPHKCITKSFTADIDAINDWSRKFYSVVRGSIGYVKGDLYHIWHGDLQSRQYLKRVQEFTPISKTIQKKDENGLHVTEDDTYVKNYFDKREVKTDDGDFLTSMTVAYATDNALIGNIIGGDPAGALLGEMLNDSNKNNDNCCGHHDNHHTNNENFS